MKVPMRILNPIALAAFVLAAPLALAQPSPFPPPPGPKQRAAEARAARERAAREGAAQGIPAGAQANPAPAATPAQAGPTAGNAGGSAKATDKCVPRTGKSMLQFDKAEILDVLKLVSEWTCKSFIYTEENVRGKITLVSKVPVSSDEFYAAFIAALSANNIAVYPSGRFYKLTRLGDAKKAPMPV